MLMPPLPPVVSLTGDATIEALNLDAQQDFQRALATGFKDEIDAILDAAGVPFPIRFPHLDSVAPRIRETRGFQSFPAHSYGLVGPSGCGKSSAAILQVRDALARNMRNAGPYRYSRSESGDIVTHAPRQAYGFVYVDAPSRCREINDYITRRLFEHERASLTNEIQAIRSGKKVLVVLDDLARETVRQGGKARMELDALVCEAYNHSQTVRMIWTSNVKIEDLEPIYGAPFLSRLIGLAPDAELPHNLPDLRIRI